jgi:hypothetical protein
MKRCPTCDRTFEEDWLAFCTQDGTTLVDDSPSKSSEPPPTIMSPPPPPPGGWKPPSGDLGSGQFQSQPIPPPPPNLATPSGGLGANQYQAPQQMQSGWQPPPPPAYNNAPQKGLAITSMVLGIFSPTLGFLCCYVLGIVTAPIAIGLGIYQLSQIKKFPDRFDGKPMAIIGIIGGAIYFVELAFIIIFYGAAILMQGFNK